MQQRFSYKMTVDFADEIKRDLARAEQRIMSQMQKHVKARVHYMTGVQVESYADLKAKGHPYALKSTRRRDTRKGKGGRFRARGRPLPPKDHINYQSGKFHRGFHVRIQNLGGGQIQLALMHDAPEMAQMLTQGTARMIGRRFGAAIGEGVEEKFRAITIKEMGTLSSIKKSW